jgi:hypothetical protein
MICDTDRRLKFQNDDCGTGNTRNSRLTATISGVGRLAMQPNADHKTDFGVRENTGKVVRISLVSRL